MFWGVRISGAHLWLIAVFLKPLLSNLYGVAGLGEVATNGLVNDNQKMYLDIYISRSE